jgi:Na+/H+-dicarboxylate symporter
MKLHTKIFAGLAIGLTVGAIARLPGADALARVLLACEPIGTAFIRLITMVVVPLVVSSLFVGVASLGDVRRLGRIGGKTLAYFFLTTLSAAIIGLAIAESAQVGRGSGPLGAESGAGVAAPSSADTPGLAQTIVAMLPQNPVASAAQTDLVPLIIAVCIFAAAATVSSGDGRRTVVSFFEGISDLSMVVIGWLMAFAPAAVAILIASTVAHSGAALLTSLALYAGVVVIALAVQGILLMAVVRFGARLPIGGFLRSVSDALLLAFSTASSNAALPVSIAAARNRLGIPNEIAGFVLPAGVTLNKNGAAAYKAVTAVFLAHVYGVELGPGQLAAIVVTSSVAAFAGAGVPGSSLVTTLVVLNAIGLGPRAAAGIALVAGIDRPLDMCRTAVNTIGNLAGAAWIARTERE